MECLFQTIREKAIFQKKSFMKDVLQSHKLKKMLFLQMAYYSVCIETFLNNNCLGGSFFCYFNFIPCWLDVSTKAYPCSRLSLLHIYIHTSKAANPKRLDFGENLRLKKIVDDVGRAKTMLNILS